MLEKMFRVDKGSIGLRGNAIDFFEKKVKWAWINEILYIGTPWINLWINSWMEFYVRFDLILNFCLKIDFESIQSWNGS